MITKLQIKQLKLLGYTKSQEEGAVLENRSFRRDDSYVWKDDKFDDLMKSHNSKIELAIRSKIANKIRRGD